MTREIPLPLQQKNYISLMTFRKSGVPVRTPVWFAEHEGKLYLFTNPNTGKVKRIRNNPHVRVAPCTMRGKIIGPEFEGTASILPAAQSDVARRVLQHKYWLMRVPWLWRKGNIFLEIELA